MLVSHLPPGVRAITLFDDFDEDFPDPFQRSTPSFPMLDTELEINACLAQTSTRLEQLSVSFNVDAELFFQSATAPGSRSWTWDRLDTLALTSRLLGPRRARGLQGASALTKLLCNAGAAALRMPKLNLIEIWDGSRGNACLFRYHRELYSCSVTLKGTWLPSLGPLVLQAWDKVALEQTGRELELHIEDQLIGSNIDCHSTAASRLDLSPLVMHPASLRQIQQETKNSRVSEHEVSPEP